MSTNYGLTTRHTLYRVTGPDQTGDIVRFAGQFKTVNGTELALFRNDTGRTFWLRPTDVERFGMRERSQ